MRKMREESIKKIRELQKKSAPDNKQNNPNSNSKDNSNFSGNANFKPQKQNNIFNNLTSLLFKDPDKTLILILILLLMDDEKNFMLVLALIYILM